MTPATTWNTVDIPISCPARIDSVPIQMSTATAVAQVAAELALEEIADRQVAVP